MRKRGAIMYKSLENGKGRSVWFGFIDILILLLLAAFICSTFFFGDNEEDTESSAQRLVFSVSLHAPYDTELFLQEGNGNAVPVRLDGKNEVFGVLLLGEDGVFYVECDLNAVEESEDREGLWILGETVLFRGSVLAVQSEIADFSLTILSLPTVAGAGSVGTTEETSQESEVMSEQEDSSPEEDKAADGAEEETEKSEELTFSEPDFKEQPDNNDAEAT